jgi:ABC-type multidrug transport system fused ATPase/permease subunit
MGLHDTPVEGERSTFATFMAIVRRSGIGLELVPSLVLLGLLAALAEAVAVSLVVALLFALLAEAPTAGLPGQVLSVVGRLFGRDWPELALCLVLIVLAKASVGFAYQALTIRFKNDVNARVLAAIHARLLDIRYQDLRAHGQGELLNVAATESWQVANAAYLLSRIAINACTIAVFALLILATSWLIAATAVAGGTLVAIASHRLAHSARKAGVHARRRINELYLHILAAVQAPRLIRAFSAEAAQKRQFREQAVLLRGDLARAEMLQSLANPISELGHVILMIALVGVSRALSVPDASALTAIALLYRLAPHAREITGNRNTFTGLYAPLGAVLNVLTQGHVDVATDGGSATPFGDTISFDAVSHQPPGAAARVLDQVSFSIPGGATTILSGPSGSGKTSIVNLLLRLYDPDGGTIRVGSTPLAVLPRAAWLARIAVAGQDMDLLEGTVEDNLRLGSPAASLAELREAAAVAGALPFIDALPNGFSTWIGSFGYNLSGGQRQRLSIARAVLRNPHLLILDEGTNAIEDTLERQVLDAIRRRLPDAALLVITHRPNPVYEANRVVRLVGGRVVSPVAAPVAGSR